MMKHLGRPRFAFVYLLVFWAFFSARTTEFSFLVSVPIIVIGAGFCAIVGNVYLSLIGMALFCATYSRKVTEEKKILRDEWPEFYESYETAVPERIPAWRPYPVRQSRWESKGVMSSGELKTMTWITVTIIALYFRHEIADRHIVLGAEERFKHIALLGLLTILITSDGVAEFLRTSCAAKYLSHGKRTA